MVGLVVRVTVLGVVFLEGVVMLVLVCDPVVGEVPLVGSGGGFPLVGLRTECGVAGRWVPGGDVGVLAGFLGAGFVVVDGVLFARSGDGGSLVRADWVVDGPRVLVVPPAGPVRVLFESEFVQRWARVVEVEVGEVEGEGGGEVSPVGVRLGVDPDFLRVLVALGVPEAGSLAEVLERVEGLVAAEVALASIEAEAGAEAAAVEGVLGVLDASKVSVPPVVDVPVPAKRGRKAER